MRIVHLSDTHGRYRSATLTEGDLAVHSGDALATGAFDEFEAFLDWFAGYPCAQKVFVPGNHDWSAQGHLTDLVDAGADRGIEVLVDRGISVRGVLVYGSPWVPYESRWNWAVEARGFSLEKFSDDLVRVRNAIPGDVEVLVTHGPALHLGDVLGPGSYWTSIGEPDPGCLLLARELGRLTRLKVHLFGHVHDSPGILERNGIRFSNSARTVTVIDL